MKEPDRGKPITSDAALSRAPIVFVATVTVVAAIFTAAMLVGPDFDARHLIGFELGVLVVLVLAGQTMRRINDRNRIKDWMNNTGTWVKGNSVVLIDSRNFDTENGSHALKTFIHKLEADGYRPAANEQTWAIREMVDAWD